MHAWQHCQVRYLPFVYSPGFAPALRGEALRGKLAALNLASPAVHVIGNGGEQRADTDRSA